MPRLRHAKLELGLRERRAGHRPHLLVLHALGGDAGDPLPAELDRWPGAIWALDFSGHGESDVAIGGGYTSEALMGDVDQALAYLQATGPPQDGGRCTLIGFGLGGWVALLTAGARPELVRGIVIADGAGLAGRPVDPAHSDVVDLRPGTRSTGPDPTAVAELEKEVRSGAYAAGFLDRFVRASDGTCPVVAITAVGSAPWLDAIADRVGVERCNLAAALERYSS